MNELLCPNCKSVKHTVFCLTSNPPKFEYQCNNCGHSLKYYERDNSFLPISQKELDVKSGMIKKLASQEGRNRMKTVTRAIYIGDIRFDDCPVFELDEEDGYFKILGDPDFRYSKEEVESNKNFIRFLVNECQVRLLNN